MDIDVPKLGGDQLDDEKLRSLRKNGSTYYQTPRETHRLLSTSLIPRMLALLGLNLI